MIYVNSAHVECESWSDTGNNRGEWNHFKIRQYPSNMPGKQEIKEIHKTVILDTAHILRKVLMYKYETYFKGKITWNVSQIVNTELLQHYVP